MRPASGPRFNGLFYTLVPNVPCQGKRERDARILPLLYPRLLEPDPGELRCRGKGDLRLRGFNLDRPESLDVGAHGSEQLAGLRAPFKETFNCPVSLCLHTCCASAVADVTRSLVGRFRCTRIVAKEPCNSCLVGFPLSHGND